MAAFIKPEDLAVFLRAARSYQGRGPVVRAALLLLPMLLLRPGELRSGDWSEVNFEKSEWVVPARRMKAQKHKKAKGPDHVVPLSKQAVAVLRALHEETGPTGLIFKGQRSHDRPMSENSMNVAIKTLGYDTSRDVTPHGFRATARTLGVELLDAEVPVIEAQLAHSVSDSLGTPYNRSALLSKRRIFMDEWSNLLEKLANEVSASTARATDGSFVHAGVPQGVTA